MCGICGYVSLNGRGVDRSVLESMNDRLVHRGPDSAGVFIDEAAGLAARRLAIIDLVTGDQPIANEDGSVIVVQNGEIYNYRELRAELAGRGHTFRTQGDTEVLVHLYEEYGLAFAERLRGMFAIAVWDRKARRLVVARDRYGIKPLFYSVQGGALSFASELKALLAAPWMTRDICVDALDAFLAFGFVPAPLTIYRGIRKLPPGTVLVWEPGMGADVRLERYTKPLAESTRPLDATDTEELVEELRERLRDSVAAHLIADVPVGVLLSGGLDSSTIVALAAELSSEPVRTFTVGFEERHFDERGAARLIAERYGTDHHEIVVPPDAVSLLPRITEVFDEPFADDSALPTYLVSELASQHVKVALSGEGGDELFGGYNFYLGHALAPALGRVASLARPLVERLPSSSSKASTFDWRVKRFARSASQPTLERHCAWKTLMPPDERKRLLVPERNGTLGPLDLLSARYAESEGLEDLARVMDLDIGVFLVDDMLVKTDRASMAHSLEVRVPILDPVVVDFAAALPSRMKVRPLSRTKKYLLRKAAEPLLPREILEGEKRGLSIPLAAWLRGELQPLVRDVLSPESVRRQGYFDPKVVEQIVDDHVAGRSDESRKLWALVTFCRWFDRRAMLGLVAFCLWFDRHLGAAKDHAFA
jgi:asparagine synthase (glutamine-hydrolysing)